MAHFQESLIPEASAEGSRMSSGDESPTESWDAGTLETPVGTLSGSFLRSVPKRRSLILRHWIGSSGNKSPTASHNISLKDCLPPAYHGAKNIGKTIKVGTCFTTTGTGISYLKQITVNTFNTIELFIGVLNNSPTKLTKSVVL